jgi:hypothetical protein
MSPQAPASRVPMLGRLEANIIAESALIDRESGRVFWEGGSGTLSGSLHPKLGIPGLSHLKATILTYLLFVAMLSVLARWIRTRMMSSTVDPATPVLHTQMSFYKSIGMILLQWTLLKTPEFHNKMFCLVVALYFIEAFTCSTRRYLTNAINSPHEVEKYTMRNHTSCRRFEPPITSGNYCSAEALVQPTPGMTLTFRSRLWHRMDQWLKERMYRGHLGEKSLAMRHPHIITLPALRMPQSQAYGGGKLPSKTKPLRL